MVTAVQSSSGQKHDRADGDNKSPNMAAQAQAGDARSDPLEITTGQRMISAMAGSLLTSLLGESHLRALCRRTEILT